MKERVYRCTRTAYAPVGRASIHDNGLGARPARAAGPIGARELLRVDLIAMETYDQGANSTAVPSRKQITRSVVVGSSREDQEHRAALSNCRILNVHLRAYSPIYN